MSMNEQQLKSLMMAGLDGDAAAYRALLAQLSAQLRSYYRGRLARVGRGVFEAEDLLQEVLLAIHTRRHTYDRAERYRLQLPALNQRVKRGNDQQGE